MNLSVLAIVSILIVWGIAIYLAIKTSIIKDPATGNHRPYSLGNTQLLWWTLIIMTCFIIALDVTQGQVLPDLNNTVLALLGISLGTTATSKIISNQQVTTGVRSTNVSSRNFVLDILSDENGVSVHRFQAVIFNIIFGISFYIQFIKSGSYIFPEYDTAQLAILGVSSAGYIALKMNEKGEKHSNVPVTAPLANKTATPPPVNQPQNVPPVAQPVTTSAPPANNPTTTPPTT